ncbi:smkA [Acrasis kona]
MRIIQGRQPDSQTIIAKNLSPKTDDSDSEESQQDDLNENELPEPKTKNLGSILKSINTMDRYTVIKSIVEQGYLSKLFDVFETCEDVEDISSCRTLFNIFKNIVLLNDNTLYETIFSDEHLMNLIGVLEYDAGLTGNIKADHRNFLRNVVSFEEVIPFTDRSVLQRIHQTFRIQYIKDTILPRSLDDQTFNALNGMIYWNNISITNAIKDDKNYLKQLLSELKSTTTPQDRRRNLAKLLLEYTLMFKHAQGYLKGEVWSKLREHGIFEVVQINICNQDSSVRHACSELLSSMMPGPDGDLVRHYIIMQYMHTKTSPFLINFIKGITDETELGIQDNLCESMRLLIDSELPSAHLKDLLVMFYDTFMSDLVKPLSRPITDPSSVQSLIRVLDLVSFLATQHSYKCKNFYIEERLVDEGRSLFELPTDRFDARRDSIDEELHRTQGHIL